MQKAQEIYNQYETSSHCSSFYLKKKVNFSVLFALLKLPFSCLVVQSHLLLVMEILLLIAFSEVDISK